MSASVQFIVAEDTAKLDRRRMACVLAEQTHLKQRRLRIVTATPEELNALDDLLWTFSDISFVPHEKLPSGQTPAAPIVLSCDAFVPAADDVIVNLANTVPAEILQAARVVELVDHDADARLAARRRYRIYQDAGCTIDTRRIHGYQDLEAIAGE